MGRNDVGCLGATGCCVGRLGVALGDVGPLVGTGPGRLLGCDGVFWAVVAALAAMGGVACLVPPNQPLLTGLLLGGAAGAD